MKVNLNKKIILALFIIALVCIIPGKVSADYIISNGVNIRSGPGTNYSIITNISRDDKEIKVISNTEDWSEIILSDGTRGYIKTSFLRQRSYMKATTSVKVRAAAKTSSAQLEILQPGDVVAVIRYGIRKTGEEVGNHKGWYRIYDLKTGVIGWCCEEYLTELEPKTVAYDTVYLRKTASLNSTSLKRLDSGDHIYVIEKNTQTGWSKVISRGEIGYIKTVTYVNGGEYVYTTTLTDHAGRNANISKAANLINGKTVLPGQVFSYLSYLGSVTQAGGYYQAPEIINGETVEGSNTYGGGICQVSSTLYNALKVLKEKSAAASIIERNLHSSRAKYVPYCTDAMVSYNAGYDFRFRANVKLKISAEVINATPKRISIKVETL